MQARLFVWMLRGIGWPCGPAVCGAAGGGESKIRLCCHGLHPVSETRDGTRGAGL